MSRSVRTITHNCMLLLLFVLLEVVIQPTCYMVDALMLPKEKKEMEVEDERMTVDDSITSTTNLREMTTTMTTSDHDNNNNKKKISVIFYGESQCPYCRKFVTEAWPTVWNDLELRSFIDYDFIPWGNAYYGTDDCGIGPYNPDERHCWWKKCIGGTTTTTMTHDEEGITATIVDDDGDDDDDDDDTKKKTIIIKDKQQQQEKKKKNDDSSRKDCFSGIPIYQHSMKEGELDIYETCVKDMLGLESAVSFTVCAEGPNMEDTTFVTSYDLMKHCLDNDPIQIQMIQHSFITIGKSLEIINAIQTPDHPGVPYVIVDGDAIDNPLDIKTIICQKLQQQEQQQLTKTTNSIPIACQDKQIE